MKKIFGALILLLALSINAKAQTADAFSAHFTDETLRLDYSLEGNAHHQRLALAEMLRFDGWAGRTVHLDSVPLHGNARITLSDPTTGQTLYATTFSTLFQEWLQTEEADADADRAFECVCLVPMPKDTVVATLTLFDSRQRVQATMKHVVVPTDILIRRLPTRDLPPHRVLRQSAVKNPIDVVIVAEGYTTAEAEKFYSRAAVADKEIFSYEPFRTFANYFKVTAIALPSKDSGVSVPLQNEWRETALSSNFSTFYSDRYLTTNHLRDLHNQIAGIPYEHIIVLANTDTYGGGGIYNAYTLTTADHSMFRPVVVHEFGHSFAALADEYGYDEYEPTYFPDMEPWEQNITTLHDFSQKWQDLLPAGTPVPTPQTDDLSAIGVYEGGGNQKKGVYHAFPDCRMRTNVATEFCAVCQRALTRLIEFYISNGEK